MLTDELLRKVSALVTDLSPIVSTLAMEIIETLFQRIPDSPEQEEEARIWMPSLTMVNIMVDALMCRLADAKAPIRSKARAALSSIIAKTDGTIMITKLTVSLLFCMCTISSY